MEKFNGGDDLNLWRIIIKHWLVYQSLFEAILKDRLEALALVEGLKLKIIMLKAHSTLVLSLDGEVLREVAYQKTH